MVGIYKCDEYDDNKLEIIIDKIFEEHNFHKYLKKGMNVVLKTNLLAIRDEKTATTTHHMFVKAVAKKVLSFGAKCTICDSPAGNYTKDVLKKMYTALNYDKLETLGVNLNLDTTHKNVNIEGKSIKNIDIITPVLEADLVINLPKLKTHAMMNLTCGVKNLFGIIPGMNKAEIHSIYPEYRKFASALVDISSSVKNQLTIVDAIYAMEGNGPNQGKPRKLGLVLASSNQFELDFVAMKIINLDIKYAYTVQESIDRKLFDVSKVDILGENLEDVIVKDFKMPDSINRSKFKGMMFFAKYMKPYPTFNKDKCVKCKLCINRCPVHALELKNNKVTLISRKNCIRCFCCSEHCPADAIRIKHRLIFSNLGEKVLLKTLGTGKNNK